MDSRRCGFVSLVLGRFIVVFFLNWVGSERERFWKDVREGKDRKLKK